MADDRLAEIAALLHDIGACYQDARRYRPVAAICEERYLDPAVEIGARIRGQVRAGSCDPREQERAIAALRDLLAECARAVATVRATELYQRTRAAWAREVREELAAGVYEIFAHLRPEVPGGLLYYEVSLEGGPGASAHFATAEHCADRILALRCDGIPATVPALGADEEIRAVALTDDAESVDSPVRLAFTAGDIGSPLFRVGEIGEVLVHVPRLRARFEIRLADEATDEWWAAGPASYDTYRAGLEAALAARGLVPGPLAGRR